MSSEPRFSFIGYPLRDGMAETWPPNIPIREEPDGVHVNRIHDKPAITVHTCLCSHPQFRHARETGRCHRGCGCATYREKDQ